MAIRDIVVFERDERYTESGKPELSFRLARQTLPAGSSPLAMVNNGEVMAWAGQNFTLEEVLAYAHLQAGIQEAA